MSRIEDHTHWIELFAKYYALRTPPNILYDDLFQEGCLVFITDRKRYRKSKGASFRTFIHFRVRGSMLDYIRTAMGYRGIGRRKVKVNIKHLHLDDFANVLTSKYGVVESEIIINDWVRKEINKLNEKQRGVIYSRYYMEEDGNSTAVNLEITSSRVYQINKQAISNMKRGLEKAL